MKYIFFLILTFFLSSCLKEDIQKETFATFSPVNINDLWQLGLPTKEKIDSIELVGIYQEIQDDPQRYWQVRSMSVFRNGKLIAESYFKDEADRTQQRPFWSCTKQVLGILIGIAVDQGLIESIDDPINKYLEDDLKNYPEKQNITIRQLLMMKSGINFENYGLTSDDSEILQQKPSNLLNFVLSKPMNYPPGERFHYKDGDPQILSAILEKVTGKRTNIWAQEVFFSKLNISNIDWISYKSGETVGAFGILTTPREMAKIAQCVLEKGKYNGNQIVSESWVVEMTKGQTTTDLDRDFGYMWWNYSAKNIPFMSGNGGQFLMLFPDKNLIVVFTAEDKTQGEFRFSTPNARYFSEKIANICK